MKTQREFVKLSALSIGSIALVQGCENKYTAPPTKTRQPLVISTWNHRLASNKASWKTLNSGGTALDAVEQGVRIIESDANGYSVGIGGTPDRDGHVTLDACIMNHKHQCGGVTAIENIAHPIGVVRKVMEDTSHVLLVGQGTYKFAREKDSHIKVYPSKKLELPGKVIMEWSKQTITASPHHNYIQKL